MNFASQISPYGVHQGLNGFFVYSMVYFQGRRPTGLFASLRFHKPIANTTYIILLITEYCNKIFIHNYIILLKNRISSGIIEVQ